MTVDERGMALPPSREDAEEALLGSAFLDREVVGRVSLIVSESDFYGAKNGLLYGVMLDLFERGEPVDPLTVLEGYARRRIEPDQSWLMGLLGSVPTPIHAEHYARMVAEAAVRRRLISAASRILSLGYREDVPLENALAQADELLSGVSEQRVKRGFVRVDAAMSDFMDEEEALASGSAGRLAFKVPTGYSALDKLLDGGMGRSDLTLLAARPGMGKSALALGIALNAAIRYEAGVGIFSLEMATRQLIGRMIAIESGISVRMIREQAAGPNQMREWADGVARVSEAPIWLDDTPGLTISEIRMRARQLQRTESIDLLVVDHMQLVNGTSQSQDMVRRMTEVSSRLKELARELNIPVLALAQLSRKVDERKPPSPILSDLRESGTLEQDADNVLFIYREEYYNKDCERPGTADVIVGKQRSGETGIAPLLWNAQTTKFFGVEEYLEKRR